MVDHLKAGLGPPVCVSSVNISTPASTFNILHNSHVSSIMVKFCSCVTGPRVLSGADESSPYAPPSCSFVHSAAFVVALFCSSCAAPWFPQLLLLHCSSVVPSAASPSPLVFVPSFSTIPLTLSLLFLVIILCLHSLAIAALLRTRSCGWSSASRWLVAVWSSTGGVGCLSFHPPSPPWQCHGAPARHHPSRPKRQQQVLEVKQHPHDA